jgi:formylglycine-generating enzyme required for sulfatase activity
MKIKHIISALVLTGLLGGCDFFLGRPDLPAGNVTIRLGPGGVSKAVFSSSLHYELELEGPENQRISRNVAAGTGAVNFSLALGDWDIIARAYAPDNSLFATGQKGAAVGPGGTDVVITMQIVTGVPVSITVGAVTFDMRYVPSGSFQRDATVTNITNITKGYWMSETEVTQELWLEVMGTAPYTFPGATNPANNINWYRAIAFCSKLSLRDGKDPVYTVGGVDWNTLASTSSPISSDATWNAASADFSKNGYRLPTHMEWMWAAMGADVGNPGQPNTTRYNKGYAGSTEAGPAYANIGDYAWIGSNSGSTTKPVKGKLPNELNLYDMTGNVYEWCWDWSAALPAGMLNDYPGPSTGTDRRKPGGAFFSGSNLSLPDGMSTDSVLTPQTVDHTVGLRIVRNVP